MPKADDSDMEGFGSDVELPADEEAKGKPKKSKIEAQKHFEEVPVEAAYSDMDSDDIAETRALAKIML